MSSIVPPLILGDVNVLLVRVSFPFVKETVPVASGSVIVRAAVGSVIACNVVPFVVPSL